ncbi:hypothetical protein ACFVKB_17020 [Rhodococcus sp. NPDC127530]|uniref:hypothetical protein n=1 Tax=unclassified Rhodococcus (in: high G+C Gram-positive bacteria) TaxID=192944 RepID=UPI003624E587
MTTKSDAPHNSLAAAASRRVDVLRAAAVQARRAADEAAVAAARASDLAADCAAADEASSSADAEASRLAAPIHEAERSTRTRMSRFGMVCTFLLVVAVIATGVGSWMTSEYLASQRDRQADAQVLQFAESSVVQLISTRKDDADSYVQRVLDSSTGQWHDEFEERKAAVVDTMKQAGGEISGQTLSSGIERRNSDGSITVLVSALGQGTVLLNQPPAEGAAPPAPNAESQTAPESERILATMEPQQYQIRLDVVSVDDQLKVAKVGFVQ